MPEISCRLRNIVPEGETDGWEVHFSAFARRKSGEDILMLSIGDHEFDTPEKTVEACARGPWRPSSLFRNRRHALVAGGNRRDDGGNNRRWHGG